MKGRARVRGCISSEWVSSLRRDVAAVRWLLRRGAEGLYLGNEKSDACQLSYCD